MASAKLKQVSPAPTIGSLIDLMKTIAVQRSELSAKDKTLAEQQKSLEQQIIEAMDKQETRVGEGKIAKASIVESEEPQVENWEEFLAWAQRNKCVNTLVQRRVSAPAWREMRALKKKEIPGIGVFHKRSLNLRAV